jgi:hypothetical protein
MIFGIIKANFVAATKLHTIFQQLGYKKSSVQIQFQKSYFDVYV